MLNVMFNGLFNGAELSMPENHMERVQPPIHLFEIAYSIETLNNIGKGFLVLDNLRNERPDWFEYWPIRNFLLKETLDEDAFYGFFSPRHREKLGLSANQIMEFVLHQSRETDVVIFSPQPDMGAFFINTFEQADCFDADMMATYENVLHAAGIKISIKDLVMDSRHVVFSNYLVARPSFWRMWLSVNEVLFSLAENSQDAVGFQLRVPTNYPGAPHRKVFLQERTASFILRMDKRWKSVRYDAFKTAWSASVLNKYPTEAVISDALKIAFNETGDDEYIKAYSSIRDKLFYGTPNEPLAEQRDYSSGILSSQLPNLTDVIDSASRFSAEGKLNDACQIYETYIASDPGPIAYIAYHNLAVFLFQSGRLNDAVSNLRHTLELNPRFVQGYLSLGRVLEQASRPQEAISCWDRGLSMISGSDEGSEANRVLLLNNIGRLKEMISDFDGAEKALLESILIDPSQGDVWHHWIHLRQKQCKWPALDGRLTRSDLLRYASPLTILSLSDDPAEQFVCSRRLVSQKVGRFERMTATSHRYNHDRIRIGYLSSDLSMHAVSLLTVELFEQHDRKNFEVHAFCWSREDGTPFRERVRAAFDHFHRIAELDDAEAAALIRRYEIDILVDLHGLSAKARPNIIARGPAPLQITWLGYPGTSAIPYNDYVVADDFVMPRELEPYFTEKPLRLSTLFQVSDSQRVFGPERSRSFFSLPDEAFVYCAFNNNYKITPEIFDAWMRILRQAPNSVLWLLEDNQWSRRNLLSRAETANIDLSRLIFAGRIDPRDYLTRFRAADIFLDTNPYNAGTTANDALWAGLPLLTYAGNTYTSRMAGSLLRAAGLPELITHTLEDYEKAAVHFANHRDELAVLTERLRQRKETGELFSTKRFVAEFEDALVKLIHTQ